MKNGVKIVVIGAGSASFGLETLTGLLSQKALKGKTTLCLVDINPEGLKSVEKLASLISEKYNSNMKIIATTERKEVLDGADFVILSVAQDREDTWIRDHELAKKYDIWHYAENGGPGSFSHTARNLAFIMPILEDINKMAPEAWILNYTNPVPRIGYAVQYAGLKYIGLCHQIWEAYALIGRYLARDLGITDPELLNLEYEWSEEGHERMHKLMDAAYEKYRVLAAGLNHFIWVLDIRRKDTWEDIYPLLRSEMVQVNENFEPLTRHMFKLFGTMPCPTDTHLAEYVGYTATEANWKKYNIKLYDFQHGREKRDEMWKDINEIISGKKQLDIEPNFHERADSIIAEMVTNANAYEQSVNIENNGSISNLPDDAIVEVPALISSYTVSGMKVGPLPESVAALCYREISIAKLMTRGSIEGDKEKIVKAFALDPMVNDLTKAEEMVDDYINTHKKYLPQFGG